MFTEKFLSQLRAFVLRREPNAHAALESESWPWPRESSGPITNQKRNVENETISLSRSLLTKCVMYLAQKRNIRIRTILFVGEGGICFCASFCSRG